MNNPEFLFVVWIAAGLVFWLFVILWIVERLLG